MMICSAALSDPGRVRPGNEDSCLVDEALGLFLVADGMGGCLAGEVASRMAVETVHACLAENAADHGVQPVSNAARLAAAVARANHDIYAAARSRDDWQGMGTTIAAVLLKGARLTVAHAGDSRVYLARGRSVIRLTEDHSAVRGQTPEETYAFNRHVITRALGPLPQIDAEISEADLMAGDRLLLCSDGLTGEVSDDEILSVLTAAANPLAACQRLVALANERGGDDNITTVAIFLAAEGYLPRLWRWARR
jgi:serine/threonine protein phosphatase PrpC